MIDKRMIKSISSFDVAKRAGVSQSSVSRVFNEKWNDRISHKTREKVLKAAEELGYSPNALARGLNSNRTGIIGVVLSDTYNVYYYGLLNILTNLLQEYGLRVMVFNTAPDSDIDQILRRLLEYCVDGIIITSSALTHKISGEWKKKGIPLVLLNVYSPNTDINMVYSDNYGAGERAARFLYGLGMREFAYVSAEESCYLNHDERQEGFLGGLKQCGITQCMIQAGDYSYESGYRAGDRIFASGLPVEAIFCANDLMALGVMDCGRLKYKYVPGEDYSIMGLDDTFAASLRSYSLTVLQQQNDILCKEAVRVLIENMENPEMPPETVAVPMQLIVRNTVRH